MKREKKARKISRVHLSFLTSKIRAAIFGKGGLFRSTTVWMRIHREGLARVAVFLPSFRQLQRCNPRPLLDYLQN